MGVQIINGVPFVQKETLFRIKYLKHWSGPVPLRFHFHMLGYFMLGQGATALQNATTPPPNVHMCGCVFLPFTTPYYTGANVVLARADVVATKLGIILHLSSFHLLFSQKGFA